MTEDRKVAGYELAEKSKEDEPIMLCMVIDKGKVIGAYLDYSGYSPGITSIDFKYNFKLIFYLQNEFRFKRDWNSNCYSKSITMYLLFN